MACLLVANFMERFIIIDGNAILHRAFHAIPPFKTSSGKLVNAVYGFASMLIKLRDGFKPSYMAVTFDLPKPTFRKKIYKEYQIKRPKMDEGLVSQVELVKDLVRVLGIPIYEQEGYEADDVIGTLVFQAGDQKMEQNLETIIITGDRDILQLINEKVKVYMPTKGITEAVLYDREKVKEKFGILPALIPDYKGLVGDQSDNYPGVEGIGPKTAEKLLTQFGSFPHIYDCLSKIKEEIKVKLLRGRKEGEISYKLATIIKDAPVVLNLEECKTKDINNPAVIKFLEKMEFMSLIRRLNRQQDGDSKKQLLDNKNAKRKIEGESQEENQMKLFN